MQLWTLQCVYFFELVFLVLFLDTHPEVELLDHEVVLFVGFENPPRCFPQRLHQFTALPPSVGAFCLHWVYYGQALGSRKVGHCGIRGGVPVVMSRAGPFHPHTIDHISCHILGFQSGPVVRNPSANAGDSGSISGSGRSPGEGNGNPFQYSCLGNPWAAVHGVAKSRTYLSNWARTDTSPSDPARTRWPSW